VILSVIYLFLALIYAMVIFYFYWGLFRLPKIKTGGFTPRVSVLVPARNEEDSILRCLKSLWSQTYPKDQFEVFIIDDHSTDATAAVVERFILDKPNFTLLRHDKTPLKPTFKKQALDFGLKSVTGKVIMTIDADTVAQPKWIEKILGNYKSKTGMVAGLITFDKELETSIFHKMQTLEFAGIVFCGVGAVGNRNPVICNGSNLSYRLKAFKDAGGYKGNEHLPSGDDDLLLQKIHTQTNWDITYALSPGSINYTAPISTLKGFLNQRARWASKSLHYPKKWLLLLMLSVYFFYAFTLLLIPLCFLQLFSWKIYLVGIILKIVPEYLILMKGLKILNRRELIWYFIPAQFFQSLYVLIVGFLGFSKKYTWKGLNGNSLS
jgi:cellulose synthase/poly-beta-1,6-N-acetylglucosamine synthase-like glycosyltransferase